MSALEELKKYEEYIYRCIHCKTCRMAYTDDPEKIYPENCPAGKKFEWEAFYNSGKMWILKAILEGELDWNERVAEIFYLCPTCGNCQQQCENDIPTVEIIEAVRAVCVEKGLGPLPRQKMFGELTAKYRNPYGEPHEKRLDWLPSDIRNSLPEKADVYYFVGCTASYRIQNVALATVSVLRKLGINFTISPDEWCCNSPLLRTGQLSLAKEYMQHNIDVIEKTGASVVITSCAGCYRTLKVDFPRFVGKYDFEVKHSVEFIYDLIQEGKLDPSKFKKINLVATYHDPCHYGRHIVLRMEDRKKKEEFFEVPRKIIEYLGIELREMRRIKADSWCCGAGGGVKAGAPDFALETAMERIKEALETGAQALLSACPFCYRNLTDAIKAMNAKLEFYDLIELLDKAIQ
ncbi:MAG: (Fe-S)-binding protein [Candidatus Baldrarchaeia archaeon]